MSIIIVLKFFHIERIGGSQPIGDLRLADEIAREEVSTFKNLQTGNPFETTASSCRCLTLANLSGMNLIPEHSTLPVMKG